MSHRILSNQATLFSAKLKLTHLSENLKYYLTGQFYYKPLIESVKFKTVNNFYFLLDVNKVNKVNIPKKYSEDLMGWSFLGLVPL